MIPFEIEDMKNVINSFASMKFNNNYKIFKIYDKMVGSVKKSEH